MPGSEHDDDKTQRARRPRPRPPEVSPEGRVVIRSSSHPPGESGEPPHVSGVHPHPLLERYADPRPVAPGHVASEGERDRFKRSTPAERPRKRKSLRAVQVSDTRPHRPTPRAYPHRSAVTPLTAAESGEVSGRYRIPTASQPAGAPAASPAPIEALPAKDATAASTPTAEREEVTRRSRRPEPPATDAHPPLALKPRAVPTAVIVAMLLVLALWWLLS